MLASLDAGDADVMYSEPGRMASLGGSKVPAFFVFSADDLGATGNDVQTQKQHLIEAFAGCRWRVPELMAQIPNATEFSMDSVSRAA